jgi:Tol biopolymer transport system component
MKSSPRELADGQRCQVWLHDTGGSGNSLLYETETILLEAPNWTLDGRDLILNGAGQLWRLPVAQPDLLPISISGSPPLNNDHVLDPDGEHIFLSAMDDWHLYRAALAGGAAARITGAAAPDGLMHFLHGVSPDRSRLAFVGLHFDEAKTFAVLSAEIYTVAVDGTDYRQVTRDGVPADGPEFSPDGAWLYYNTESFSGHAQIARVRPDGSEPTRLTFSDTVDWFPHLSPSGNSAVYLAYPSGTTGHPADHWVRLMIVSDGRWHEAECVARIFGGQGTINVNSWSPDSRRFAYVAFPMA